MGERQRNYVRIINTPPGGAPDLIREEWVEMYLPLAREFANRVVESLVEVDGELPDDSELLKDVLPDDIETGRETTANAGGYVINADEAIEMLERKGTKGGHEAAEYWRQKITQLYGHYIGVQLFFSRNACEFVGKRKE